MKYYLVDYDIQKKKVLLEFQAYLKMMLYVFSVKKR